MSRINNVHFYLLVYNKVKFADLYILSYLVYLCKLNIIVLLSAL